MASCASFTCSGLGGAIPQWSVRPGGHHPVVGAMRLILVIDLQNLRRIFDYKSKRIDEVGENIVARAASTNSPSDREASTNIGLSLA